jgi:hypothetical protein
MILVTVNGRRTAAAPWLWTARRADPSCLPVDVRPPLSSRGCRDMALTHHTHDARSNPVDVVEQLATANDWSFSRASDDEVTILVGGQWTDYQVSFTWMPDIEALHLACAFELKVPDRRRSEVLELACLVNEQLWVGHFDVWSNDGIIMFRQALVLTGGVHATDGQCEAVLGMALDACERYYQAFQFVLWAGKSPREALESSMFETSGQA